MKILITESQLKFLVINEQLLPSVEQATKKYYFPNQKEADGFRAWVHQSYPEIAKSNNLEKSSPYYQSQDIVNVMDTKDPKKPNQSLLLSYRYWQSKNPQQNNNKVKVINHCGVINEYDYQTWYYDISEYNPSGSNYGKPRKDLKTYTIDGTTSPYTAKFNGDWSYLIPNLNSKTPKEKEEEKKKLCEKPASQRYGGNYREQPNLIGLGFKELAGWISESADFLQNFVDYVSLVADFIVPGSGFIIDIINTLVYLLRALLTSDTTKRNDLYLMTIVSAAFIFIPGPAQSVAPAIKTFVRSKVMTDFVLNGLKTILGFVDRVVLDLTNNAIEALKSPLAQTIATSFSVNASNIVEKIKTFGESLKNIINNLLTTAE